MLLVNVSPSARTDHDLAPLATDPSRPRASRPISDDSLRKSAGEQLVTLRHEHPRLRRHGLGADSTASAPGLQSIARADST